MRRHELLAAVYIVAYFGLSFAALQLLAFAPPNWVEQAISLFAAPAVFLLAVWNPLLRPLGMVTGEWFVLPNLAASIFLVGLYAAFSCLVARAVNAMRSR